MLTNFVKLRREFNKWWDNYAIDTHMDNREQCRTAAWLAWEAANKLQPKHFPYDTDAGDP